MTALLALGLFAAMSPNACDYGAADRAANARLSWTAFDQSAEVLHTAMWYSANRCWRQAVEAGRDYLATGPALTVREHAIVTFHMARNLARAGDRAGAALLAASSRRSDQTADAALDWNAYVAGFYGYLIGDRSALERARATLVAAGGEGNLINAGVLDRCARCLDRPFAEVETDAACGPPAK